MPKMSSDWIFLLQVASSGDAHTIFMLLIQILGIRSGGILWHKTSLQYLFLLSNAVQHLDPHYCSHGNTI